MLDNLLDLVKQYAGDAIVNNPDIPNDQNDAAIEATSSSIFSSLQSQASGGGLGNILNMFTGNAGSGGASAGAIAGVAGSLMEKFGLDSTKAQGIAATLVPQVLNNLVSKTNDPNDSSFNLNGILGSLTGGKTDGLDLTNVVTQLKGSDGQFSLDDITNLFNQQGGDQGGGGLMDKLKGLY
ncbi:hypothetical protein [Solitalea canadensis]|uniref:DUF937 domain-containing protein n=1 Tax=Solitalea canadensis (strain ATCC 29591 / DSM 3403 / JCM 21819 / LMG 8368 / NBRC 15130 / NCIMB 12057 / USAM 9D) TaxID=929556 RepID=H8KPP3_SOLCM|nr:hypothetical protein [Solitalea canadensis]AFD05941.1 hypothetical protein Solca_0824 [Solitalea canadensis DSM 3403]